MSGRKPTPDSLLAGKRTEEYPEYLWWTIAGYVAAVSVVNWSSWALRKLSSGNRTAPDVEGRTVPKRSGIGRLPDALLSTFRVVAFRWTLNIGPTYSINVADLFTAAAYLITVFTLTFINTTDLSGNKLSTTYWGNRAGALAAIQFPLVTALGTKNNIIGWITGLSHDKLNFLHRVVARTIFILIWLHAGPKIEHGILKPGHREMYNWGLAACCIFAGLIVVSIRPVRAAAYELFFYLHFLMILAILVLSYFHAAEARAGAYVWPAFLIWALDRSIRFFRLVIFNHSYFGFSSGTTMDAKLELQSEHFVRVSLRRPSHFHWSPGQTAYLTMPTVSTIPFEAHPFTIASHDSSHDGPDGGVLEKDGSGDSADKFWKELVFLINVRKGFTKNLAKIAKKKGTVKVFIDGPYGPTPQSRAIDGAVLVAGGSGVSYTLPVLLEIIENVRLNRSPARKVTFVWSLRQASHIRWISDALTKALKRAPSSLQIDIQVYVTGSNGGSLNWDDSSSTGESSEDVSSPPSTLEKSKSTPPPSILNEPNFRLIEGRPDLSALLKQEVEGTSGRLSVAVCGSQSVASAVRSALSLSVAGPASVMSGSANVTLHVESFGYA